MCCFCILAGLEEEEAPRPRPPPPRGDAAEVMLLFPGFSWCQKGWGQSTEGASWKEGLVSRMDSAPAALDTGS